ncbi:hypothetical protein ACFYNM_22420 [Streptomyces spororaveus]
MLHKDLVEVAEAVFAAENTNLPERPRRDPGSPPRPLVEQSSTAVS